MIDYFIILQKAQIIGKTSENQKYEDTKSFIF